MDLEVIAENIQIKLSNKFSPVASEINQKLQGFQLGYENESLFVQFLLKTACEFNLLKETHELLELNLFKDINLPIQSNNGLTLLGLASFHGHVELVNYLVEVRLANINAKDMNGDTPLHQVVYGDSFQFRHGSNGGFHDKVAEYLIRNGGDLSIKNNKQQTPYDHVMSSAPLKLEYMVGRRIITTHHADKVRPVFETGWLVNPVSQAKAFDKFCLEHAIELYVKNNRIGFGFSNPEALYKALESLSKEEWENTSKIISRQEPSLSFTLIRSTASQEIWRYNDKPYLLRDQLPKIRNISALIGLTTTLYTYYLTQNIIISAATGTISAVLAWSYLKETAYKGKIKDLALQFERANDLQQHNRFFKVKVRQSAINLLEQVLGKTQHDLESTNTESNEVYQYT